MLLVFKFRKKKHQKFKWIDQQQNLKPKAPSTLTIYRPNNNYIKNVEIRLIIHSVKALLTNLNQTTDKTKSDKLNQWLIKKKQNNLLINLTDKYFI